MRVALSTSVSAQSFPFTPACPGSSTPPRFTAGCDKTLVLAGFCFQTSFQFHMMVNVLGVETMHVHIGFIDPDSFHCWRGQNQICSFWARSSFMEFKLNLLVTSTQQIMDRVCFCGLAVYLRVIADACLEWAKQLPSSFGVRSLKACTTVAAIKFHMVTRLLITVAYC